MSTKGLPELPKDAAEWLVTNKPKAAIETLIEQAEEIASLQRERDAAYQAGLEAGAKDKADAERWRLASTSRNFGITYWSEYGQGVIHDGFAERQIDAALAAMKKEHP